MNRRRPTRSAGRAALLCCACFCAPLAAHEGEAVTLDAVEVSAPAAGSAGTPDAASAGQWRGAELAQRPLARVGELLEAVPGLVVTQHSGSGKANQYFLRGFNLDHGTDFRTTVAGMPANLPSHGHGQGYTDLNFVIPELVSAIQYRKGPYAAQDGDFAAAGAAELRYRTRLPQPLLRAEWGEDGQRRALLAASTARFSGDTLLALDWSAQDGPWEVPEDGRRLNAVLSQDFALAEDQLTLRAMAHDARWTATDQLPRRALQQGRVGRYGSLDPSDGGETRRYSLSGDWQRSLDRVDLGASLYAIDSDFRLYSNFSYFLDDPVNGDQFEQLDRRRVYGGRLTLDDHTQLGGRALQQTLGLELSHDDIDALALHRTRARSRLSTVRSDRVRQSSAALYYEGRLQWHERLRSVLGLRADAYRFDVDAGRAENGGQVDDAIFSPKLALVFGPWSRTELFVNAAGGFHSNDARGTTLTLDPASGAPAARADPLVRARAAELGLRTRPLPQWHSALALWALHLDSELLLVGDAGTTAASRPSARQGLEWTQEWRPRSGLLLDASLAWSRARFRDTDAAGEAIPGAVERSLALGIAVEDWRGWSGALRLRHFGERALLEDRSVRAAASTLVNAQLGYELQPRLQLGLQVFNLCDRELSDIEYYYASRLAGESAPVEDIHFHPAPPRSWRATLGYRF